MAKFYGKIGFAEIVTIRPGVMKEQITEREYYGDINKSGRRLQSANEVNDDVIITNEISIVADPFATENIYAMRYIIYGGAKWKIASVDIRYPRLVLTMGGLYNVNE